MTRDDFTIFFSSRVEFDSSMTDDDDDDLMMEKRKGCFLYHIDR
jgi:hypothetical protein